MQLLSIAQLENQSNASDLVGELVKLFETIGRHEKQRDNLICLYILVGFVPLSLTKARMRKASEIRINNLATQPWCMIVKNRWLYFFPEEVVVKEDDEFSIVPYGALQASVTSYKGNVFHYANPVLLTFSTSDGPFFEMVVGEGALAEDFCARVKNWSEAA